ncbi:hypothetical protein MNBD_GAMMA26-391 [hydrothermal vent metagenome]|uniref:Uncharacterized protein n=1 Tax=hydrothermal vent metagenome TaxID=652676 RepID=A0A3B1AUZ0_9ZZZZ
MDEIFEFIGKMIAVGGTAAAIAYAFFIFLGKKWLENKFSESLEAYKHKQNKEIEEVRYRINAQFNRITKIHEKEIEVLPKAWHKMHDALKHLTYFASPFRQHPDLDRMNQSQLNEFLDNSSFCEWEKTKLLEAPRKLEVYQERIFWHELSETKSAFREFHNYILENSIFLSQDLKEKFMVIDNVMWSAIIDKEVGHESKDWKMQRKSYSQITEEIDPIKQEIEALVQKRLQIDRANENNVFLQVNQPDVLFLERIW